MGALLGPDFPEDIGLAVSGGGDSMAMLHLAAGWARVYGVRLRVATVNHGLRNESAAEAALVADECRGLGLPHAVLRWEDRPAGGNLMDRARRARLELIGRWRGVCRHVLFAHTRDDQAETVLMRLARGSGVEGLSGMAARRRVPGPTGLHPIHVPAGPPRPATMEGGWEVVRPLLDTSRAELRHYLKALRIPFVDDPTNEDPAYDRVRVRRALSMLAEEGVTAEGLAATAARMGRAREALERRAVEAARALLRPDPLAAGTLVFDRDGFAALDADTRLRLFAAALGHVASAEYRPRGAALEDAADRWLAGGTVVLHGGMGIARGDRLFVCREPKAVADEVATVGDDGATWDRRWHLSGSEIRGMEVRPLGEAGLAQLALPVVRPPRETLRGLPSVWAGGRLVACAPLGHGPAHIVRLLPPRGPFPDVLLSH
ncbi:tRNA(Ile)-lysidine synthetase, N-terminal domain protein [Wenxinia marina DSM 24838]|uniref:tRNA(Ile)-lysidine synthase n=2 Tax=Wenxinia TaxID=653686 RepID=A0A0D0QBT8_9RHOB|nr:tRNA(Ile)-lysidine synthetase, N-terminal domain protein [Wenxinia marina DSM 24838]